MATKEKKAPEHTCEASIGWSIMEQRDYLCSAPARYFEPLRLSDKMGWQCGHHAPSVHAQRARTGRATRDDKERPGREKREAERKAREDAVAFALETHARERRLLRAMAAEKNSRRKVTMQQTDEGFRVSFWDKSLNDNFNLLADADGCPIISNELNAALIEALGEAKP